MPAPETPPVERLFPLGAPALADVLPVLAAPAALEVPFDTVPLQAGMESTASAAPEASACSSLNLNAFKRNSRAKDMPILAIRTVLNFANSSSSAGR